MCPESDPKPSSESPGLPHKVLVGTHHKTGTEWMTAVFFRIREHYDIDLDFNFHSRFDPDVLARPFRGVHLIRDPRDVIISGCFYHQKCGEPWFHRPREDFEGLTYQEKIRSLGSLDEQIMFEMENRAADTIGDMLSWDYSRSSFFELKYEDLIEDTQLMLFHEVFIFLGFPGSLIPHLLSIAYENSLFSGLVESDHVRSGKKDQWRRFFQQNHKDRFLELFGDALIRLGYETDAGWPAKA